MKSFNSKEYKIYAVFLNNLAKELTKFYYSRLNKTFKVSNKLKGKGYDPVTTADKAYEKFIRSKINKRFPKHQVIGEEFGIKKSSSDYTWVIDPIDGTRSFVIGNPTWSNLISLNYKEEPVLGMANFPILKKYYINFSDKLAYVFDNGKKKKLTVNKKVIFSKIKVSAAFHGWLSLDKQKKIPKILKLMQFPCSDALSYSHLAEGRVDAVIQCSNKIWDIHPVIPIIKAAGGIISTWDNKDAVYAGNILVSANKKIHNKLLKLLRPVSK
ncbi:inositol monophosphatase [Pelagibacteraceae bacterium]|jgi:myo-inositol-1(or 4)-monophosphatase|nr:inositol monophosphatase [Candidatus Pelagibacter sp.]MDC1485418.1 inositol monophosphatase [Pelagibacteraceae bacterium]